MKYVRLQTELAKRYLELNWNEWFANALRSETPKHGRGNDRLTPPGLSYGSGESENRIELGEGS